MSSEQQDDPREVVAEGTLVRAAEFAYEGARRLAGPDEPIELVGTVYSILGNLKLAGDSLADASEQLASSLTAAVERGGLRHDRGGDPELDAARASVELEDAAAAARALGARFAAAQAAIAFVASRDPDA
jgi:hypothetical protein